MLKKMLLMLALLAASAVAEPNVIPLCPSRVFIGGYDLITTSSNLQLNGIKVEVECVEYPAGTILNVGLDPNSYFVEYTPQLSDVGKNVKFIWQITYPQSVCLTEYTQIVVWDIPILQPVEPPLPPIRPFVAQ